MADKIVEGKRRKQLEKVKRKRRLDALRLQAEKRRREEVMAAVAPPAVVELSSDEEQQQQVEDAGEVSNSEREKLISQEIAKIKPITRWAAAASPSRAHLCEV